MGASAVVGSMIMGASQASKQRKAQREAMAANERMLEREIAERENAYKRMLPMYQQMYGDVTGKYQNIIEKAEASHEKQNILLSGAQRAAQAGYRDAMQMAQANATAGSMGVGRYGSVLAAQMGAGFAGQVAKQNEATQANVGQMLAAQESMQGQEMRGLEQGLLANQQQITGNMIGLDQWRASGNTQSMMNTVYQAPPPGQNFGSSMLMAMGMAGGPTKFFEGMTS